jgi:hypothetical protein
MEIRFIKVEGKLTLNIKVSQHSRKVKYLTFESLLIENLTERDFNSKAYLRSFKARPHISKEKVDSADGHAYLSSGQWWSQMNYDGMNKRYVCAASLTYEIFISIYDVNSRSAFAARSIDFSKSLAAGMDKFIKKIKRPNLEARIIGLQNKSGIGPLLGISSWLSKRSVPICEIDLFGTSVRHVAIDLHTGMSFNILMEDRLYKPGELENKITMEQFERDLKKTVS